MKTIVFFWRKKARLSAAVFAALMLTVFCACTEPAPLYGTWADNRGNTIAFYDNNTFNAKVIDDTGTRNYSGNYTLLRNSLTLDVPAEGLRVVTEWDIRGNILYINWPASDGKTMSLTLFKVSN